MKEFKLLGNCQVCGRLQAVNGGMSQHGYTVGNGWFNGVCSGRGQKPMQQDGKLTALICEQITMQIAELTEKMLNVQNGKLKPATAPVGSFYKAEHVPFEQASPHMQEYEIKLMIHRLHSRIEGGKSHIEMLTRILNKVSGTDLIKEAIAKPLPKILIGEKRQGERHIMICKSVDGARIYWRTESGLKSWTGIAAWRKLPLINDAAK